MQLLLESGRGVEKSFEREAGLYDCFGLLLPSGQVAYFDGSGSPFGVEVVGNALLRTGLLQVPIATPIELLTSQAAYQLVVGQAGAVATTATSYHPVGSRSRRAAVSSPTGMSARAWPDSSVGKGRSGKLEKPTKRSRVSSSQIIAVLALMICLLVVISFCVSPYDAASRVASAEQNLFHSQSQYASGSSKQPSSGLTSNGAVRVGGVVAVVTTNSSSYNPIGPVTISLSVFKEFLAEMHSPALPEADTMYAACAGLSCDPAVMAAFFEHESSGGRYGAASVTRSVGNIRCSAGYACYNTGSNGSFRQYASWTAGAADWARLLQMYKNDWKLSTLEEIIPHYAPQADHNDEAAYRSSVIRRVDDLRRREALLRKSVGTSTPAVSSTSDSGQSSDTAATNNNSNSVDMPLGCPVWESDWTITQGYNAKHPEIDIARPLTVAFGTNIHTTIGGVVTVVRDDPLFGNRVFVSNGTFTLHFNHLLPDLLLLNGQVVRRGDIVGLMGSTGNSTGPHLDYEIFQGDRRLNPMEWVVRAAPNS